MTERHHYKYVILDSSKENHNAVQAKFNVQIPHGITNASRVCVKSFSMPNSYHNVYGDLAKVRFVEFFRPTAGADWVYEIFNFSLPQGYFETGDLIFWHRDHEGIRWVHHRSAHRSGGFSDHRDCLPLHLVVP